MADARRIEEALAHIRAAEKSLKTGLLKWQPDYEIACDEYQLAATCYRNAKRYDECRATLMKAADCHLQARSLFHAAKCYEQVILMMREQGALDQIEALAHRACKLYQQQGSPEAAASALDRAAKIVEQRLPEHALQLYRHALEVMLLEDHTRHAAEHASKVSRLYVRLQRYDEAVEALRQEMSLGVETESSGIVGRLCVALVLVQLAREDSVAAMKVSTILCCAVSWTFLLVNLSGYHDFCVRDFVTIPVTSKTMLCFYTIYLFQLFRLRPLKAFREWGGYCDSNEVQTLHQLLDAYDQEDAEAAQKALRAPFIMHMDVEYARLARNLQPPEGIAEVPRAAASNAGATAGKSSLFDEEEDEEEIRQPATKQTDETEAVRKQLAKKSMFEDEEDEEDGDEKKQPPAAAKTAAAAADADDDDEGLC